MSSPSARAQEELIKTINRYNREIIETEQNIQIQERELNTIQTEAKQKKIQKNKQKKKLTILDNKLNLKRNQTKAIQNKLNDVETIKKIHSQQIEEYKKQIENIETKLDENHSCLVNSLSNSATALRDVNKKLYYLNIDDMYIKQKKSINIIQQFIEKTVINGYNIMGVPQNMIDSRINNHRKNINQNQNQNNNYKQKEIIKLNNKIKELNDNISKLNEQYKSDKDEHSKYLHQIKIYQNKLNELKHQNINYNNGYNRKRMIEQKDVMNKSFLWIQQNFIPSIKSFKEALKELAKSDDRFNDNQPLPFVNLDWTVLKTKDCMERYFKDFPRVEKTVKSCTWEILKQDARNKINS